MKILWTKPAAEAFEKLPSSARQDIIERIEMVLDFPERYPVREHQLYDGFRYFFTKDWCVSYTTAEGNLIILAVFLARRGS